jgi:hypothetical protein
MYLLSKWIDICLNIQCLVISHLHTSQLNKNVNGRMYLQVFALAVV